MNIVEIEFLEIEKNNEYIKLITDVLNRCYQTETLPKNLYTNIILTTQEKIQEYNKTYRNIDKTTDVLSFPMFEKQEIEQVKKIETEEVLGDIIISIPQIILQAKEYEHSIQRELSYMVVHGFYHLIGYDHEKEEDKKQMRTKEEEILKKCI